ncbi:hypothetical protein EGW08_015388 [Elysia chlorotica]|uniref:Uncharacterized protein n=1 Tax=Elysia chlorotica TaxID=188477 RepID=A0A3S0ZKD1_ELYCH|nr:hypothetical protein EGW08_015388 [Elysia chlorotica]
MSWKHHNFFSAINVSFIEHGRHKLYHSSYWGYWEAFTEFFMIYLNKCTSFLNFWTSKIFRKIHLFSISPIATLTLNLSLRSLHELTQLNSSITKGEITHKQFMYSVHLKSLVLNKFL